MFASHASAAFVAELRSSFRRVRTYVFVAVAAAGILSTLVLASLATGQVAPLAGAYAPRFVLSAGGSVWLWLFVVAAVFLAFDARHQDERALVAEVLDARSVSNLALLCGRLVGTVLVAWLALATIAMAIQGIGTVGRMVHEASGSESASLAWRLAVVVEPVSLVTLLTVDAVPALTFAAAMAMFLAAAFRRRAATILVALAVVAVHVYAVANAPMSVLPAVSLVTSHADFASDILPTYADVPTLVQRAGLLVFAVALLLGAGALYPRDDGRSRIGRGMAAVLLTAVGVAGLAGVVAHAGSDSVLRQQWLAAQEASRGFAFPDLRHVGGEVWIEPGEALALDLELTVAGGAGTSLDRLYFTLNPGLAVHAVETAGEPSETTHVDGILTVRLRESLPAGAELKLTLRASGIPDERFAYLDSAVDWRRLPAHSGLALLGKEASIFSGAYVALMPGAAWLPRAAPNLTDAAPDAFTADLLVHVPEAWLVAGPGRRESVAPGVFRFKPRQPVAEPGLFAARFERRAIEVGGVLFELLVVPPHADRLEGLDEVMAGENGVTARVGAMLAEARDRGLAYPYGGFSMVEVPARLRRYGGGWQLDTALFPSGLALVPEYGFPTRFEPVYTNPGVVYRVGPELPTETAKHKYGTLWRFFTREGAGEEPHHAARHVFQVRSAAGSAGADAALDSLCHVLATRTVWQLYDPPGLRGLFSSSPLFTAHRLADGSRVRANPFRALVWGGGHSRARTADRPAVWEAAERTALARLGDLDDAGLAADVLTLRVDRAARAIRDRYGSDKVATMLRELRRRFGDSGFDVEGLRLASAAADMDIDALLGDWLNATDMPGFRASTVEAFRLPDDGDGKPRYQALVNVRNSEAAPGLVRVIYDSANAGGSSGAIARVTTGNIPLEYSDPIPIAAESAVTIGRILEHPPKELWLRTYLSRNRAELHLPVADVDVTTSVDREPVTGVTTSAWRPREAGIIVDDLDDGFAVESTIDGIRLGGLMDPIQTETDRGLPVYQRTGGPGWARQSLPTAWGRYRRTVARIAAGRGASRAAFDAHLPGPGHWRLSYHMPSLRVAGLRSEMGSRDDRQGVYAIEVTSAEATTTFDFDAAAATQGWNAIDVLELAAGPVRVAVSDRTSGRSVVADAIRWELRER